MRCRYGLLLTTLALTALAATATASEPIVENGTVRKVVLYRAEALVTRHIPLDVAAGKVEVLVQGLPPEIKTTSLADNA